MNEIRSTYVPKWQRNQQQAPIWACLVIIAGLATLGWIIVGIFGRAIWSLL